MEVQQLRYNEALAGWKNAQNSLGITGDRLSESKIKNARLRTELLKCLNDGLPKAPVVSCCDGATSISDFANATVFAKKPSLLSERDHLTEFRLALSDLRDRFVLGSSSASRRAAGSYIAAAIGALNDEVDNINREHNHKTYAGESPNDRVSNNKQLMNQIGAMTEDLKRVSYTDARYKTRLLLLDASEALAEDCMEAFK